MAEKVREPTVDDLHNEQRVDLTENAQKREAASEGDSFLLVSYLDEVDDRVEDLRQRALDLLHERESLLTVLSQFENESTRESVPDDESQDLLATIKRLKNRCRAVDIKIHTVRSEEQEQAFSRVEPLIEALERVCIFEEVEDDHNSYRQKAQCLLNACTSDCPPNGPIDYKFQSMILGCKLEDQKLVRHRLECLVNGRCHESFVEAHIGHVFTEVASKGGQVQEQPPAKCSETSAS